MSPNSGAPVLGAGPDSRDLMRSYMGGAAVIPFIAGLRDSKDSRLFFHIAFLSCICLQRFGILMGASSLFISLPVFAALLCWMLATGRAEFRPGILILFLAFLSTVAISMTVALAFPDNRVGISLLSPIGLILNYMLLVVRPSKSFDRREGMDIFLFYARLCAACGIIQYAIQFIGIRIFSFMITVPALKPILVEGTFAYDPIMAYGSIIRRSNGFFLLEPSIFSQLLVLAVCVEFFIYGRIKYLPLYGVAYLLSFSGTGLLSLIISLPFYAIIFYRQAPRIALFGFIGLALVGAAAVLLPEQFASLSGRAGELNSSGSSGYARYVAQFSSLSTIINEGRSIIGYGPGATDRATFWVAGSGSILQKLLIDYGILGMVSFFTLVIAALWRTDLAILPILCLVIFQFGGGYLLFSPFIILFVLLCIWTLPTERPSRLAVS